MKVYRVELLIVDHDEIGEAEIIGVIENARYPNRCIAPSVMGIESKDIGEWHDDNPLNRDDSRADEFARLFPKESE